jgi:hypothetical protein
MVEEKEKEKEKERTRAVRQQPRPAAQRECGRGARASSSPSLSTPAHPRRLQSRETCDGHVKRMYFIDHQWIQWDQPVAAVKRMYFIRRTERLRLSFIKLTVAVVQAPITHATGRFTCRAREPKHAGWFPSR